MPRESYLLSNCCLRAFLSHVDRSCINAIFSNSWYCCFLQSMKEHSIGPWSCKSIPWGTLRYIFKWCKIWISCWLELLVRIWVHCSVGKSSPKRVLWFSFLVSSSNVWVSHKNFCTIVCWPGCSLRLLFIIIHLLIEQIISGGSSKFTWKHYCLWCLLLSKNIQRYCSFASSLCLKPGLWFAQVTVYA